MGGIAGIYLTSGRLVDSLKLSRMTRMLGHRGPDGMTTALLGCCGFGNTTLSTLDSHPPLQSLNDEDFPLSITLSGEIFNCSEIRKELKSLGHLFRSESQAELALRAYRQWKEQAFVRFNGQWSVAIYDHLSDDMILARDRLGSAPLYYTLVEGAVLFASEIKALFSCPEVRREIDPHALQDVFSLGVTQGKRTMFRGIYSLRPGHWLRVTSTRSVESQYWQLRYHSDASRKFEEAVEECWALLRDAVNLRVGGPSRPAAILSGGLDSSIIATLMNSSNFEAPWTYSIQLDDHDPGAMDAISTVHERIGGVHHQVRCSAREIGRLLPEVIWHAETPLLRLGPVPVYILAREAREHQVKVLLNAEGADELFGGYDLFKETKVRRFWSRNLRSDVRPQFLRHMYGTLTGNSADAETRADASLEAARQDGGHPLLSHLPRWRSAERMKRYFSIDLLASLRGVDPLEEIRNDLPQEFNGWAALEQAQYLETTSMLPGYLLSVKSDRMRMAHGVAGRSPFLDPRLIRFTSTLPNRWKILGLREKHLLKSAATGRIPDQIVNRTRNASQPPSMSSLVGPNVHPETRDYVEDLLSEATLRESGFFHLPYVEGLRKRSEEGRKVNPQDVTTLTGIISTQLFWDKFIRRYDGESGPCTS